MVVNDLWYEICDYEHLEYVTESLFDHTPLVLTFPDYPKTKAQFRFCDMWAEYESYEALVEDQCNQMGKGCHMYQLMQTLKNLKRPLQ